MSRLFAPRLHYKRYKTWLATVSCICFYFTDLFFQIPRRAEERLMLGSNGDVFGHLIRYRFPEDYLYVHIE